MSGWTLRRTTPPAVDPVTLTAAKNHLRVDVADDDELIAQQIRAATQHVEEHTGRQLITATWRLTLDRAAVCRVTLLQRPPHQAITAVTSILADGSSGTLPPADYYLVPGHDEPGKLVLDALPNSWPGALREFGAVDIDYTAGYGPNPEAVPDPIVSAIKLVIGTLYEHRETEVVGTVAQKLPHSFEWLLSPYRVWSF